MKQTEAIVGLALLEFACALYIVVKFTGNIYVIIYEVGVGVVVVASGIILAFIVFLRGIKEVGLTGIVMGIVIMGLAAILSLILFQALAQM